LAPVKGAQEVSDSEHSFNEELRRYITSPEHQSRSSSHEAGHAVLAAHFGHEVIDVSTEGEIVPKDSPDAMAINDGELAATGGNIQINWFKMNMNHPDFDDYLQNVATVLMGGRAAEELSNPDKVVPSHWKADVVYFRDVGKQARRNDAQINDFLEEGRRRAKELLSRSDLAEQHERVRNCLLDGRCGSHPNGKFVTRVMKGLS
jgi:hypothetical protein